MRSYKINTPDNIKSGYLVELQNGEKYLCVRHDQNKFEKLLINTLSGRIKKISEYDIFFNNYESIKKELNIYRIYGLSNDINTYICTSALYDTNHRPLLWERKPVEMTKKQIEEKLGYKIKIVVE